MSFNDDSEDNALWSPEKCLKEFKDDVCGMDYQKQAVFFLNAFWKDFFIKFEDLSDKEAFQFCIGTEKLLRKNKIEKSDLKDLPESEKSWIAYKCFVKLDKKGGNSDSIDEMQSHRLLEIMGQPLTVLEFRKEFRKIDQNFDKRMGMVEYLIYKYNTKGDPKDFIVEMMRRPQGINKALIKAEEELKKVQVIIDEIERKKADLTERSKLSGIKGKIAKQELAQLLAQDPLPLRRALSKASYAVKQAKKSENLNCQGKLFFTERALNEMKLYKPSSKQ